MKFILGAIVAIAIVFGVMSLANRSPNDQTDVSTSTPSPMQMVPPGDDRPVNPPAN